MGMLCPAVKPGLGSLGIGPPLIVRLQTVRALPWFEVGGLQSQLMASSIWTVDQACRDKPACRHRDTVNTIDCVSVYVSGAFYVFGGEASSTRNRTANPRSSGPAQSGPTHIHVTAFVCSSCIMPVASLQCRLAIKSEGGSDQASC